MASPAAISKDLFQQHGLACRVYDIEDKYEEVNSAALAKGVAIKQELKDRGYTDFSSFYMSCPKFSLLCWPSKLADLGGGVVLYFHFLAFCGTFLFLAFLIQLPAVMEYINADNISAWNWDEGGFDSHDFDDCRCAGTNNGYTGPGSFSQADYGMRCNTWDLAWCEQGAAGPFAQERGRWCCRSWCYASPRCPNTMADSPSLSNLLSPADGLVRSYSACEQPVLTNCDAGSGMSIDRPFPLDNFTESNEIPKSFMRITGPGNLGPDRGENATILMLYFGVLVLFAIAVVIAHQYQLRTLANVDRGTTQPNDFAIFVEGLPTTATDEPQIAEFFKEHAVVGRTDVEIAKVVIGWESKEYRENKRELKRLQAKLIFASVASNVRFVGKCISLEPAESIVQRLQQVQERIRKSAPDMAQRLVSSGVVVVVFRYQGDQRRCLERWTSLPAKLWYTDRDGALGLGKGTPLPRFFHRGLSIRRAPNPSDINWEDLGVSMPDRLKMLAKTNGAVMLLLIVCFFAIYGLEKLKESTHGGGFGWSVLPVLGIAITNMLLMTACKKFGAQEYHNTVAEQTASQSLKMAVALVMNTAGIMLFKSSQPKEWYTVLVDDLFVLLAFTGAIQPLMFLLDSKYYLVGSLKRRNLTDAQLEQWNSVIQIKEKPKTQAELVAYQRQRAQVNKQVEKMKEAFQPSELDTTKRYAVAVRTFLCCLLYSPLMPLLTLVGILGIAIQYWVDKYMLLRWFKRPAEPHPGEQAVLSLLFVRYTAVIFLPLAAFVFLHPSWRDMSECTTWLLISLGFSFVYCLTPLSVARSILCLRFMPFLRTGNRFKIMDETSPNQDYYKAQRLWTSEMKYHKSQFLYKMVPEKKNPEMLQPGTYTATSADDLKGSCGVAADSMASGAGTGAASVHVRGHGAMGLDAGALSTTASTGSILTVGGGGAAPAAPAAVVPGAADPILVRDASDQPSDPPVVTGGGTAPPPAPEPAPVKVPKPVWLYETRGGFQKFDEDCQGFIEKKYQEKLGGGNKRVNVSTTGITVSLDFDKMSQKVGRHGKIRPIRRDME